MCINYLTNTITNISLIEYLAEAVVDLIVYVFSEYVFIPMIIKPFSNSLKNKLTQYLRFNYGMDSTLSAEYDEYYVPYNSHQQNMFKSSYYTLATMTPISVASDIPGGSLTPAATTVGLQYDIFRKNYCLENTKNVYNNIVYTLSNQELFRFCDYLV